MSTSSATPLAALGRGIVSGLAGTAVMTAWQELSARLQSSGGESGNGDANQQPQDPWESASAPAKVARRIIEGVLQHEAPPEWIPALTHGMHWAYGTGWGALYGLVQESRRGSALASGLAWGTGVWAMSYVQLVPMGLYEPPWRYPATTLGKDLSYHLVYGLGVAGAFRALTRSEGRARCTVR